MHPRQSVPLLCLALLACAGRPAPVPAPGDPAFAGLTHPPLPPGLEDLGGYVVDPTVSMDDVVGHLRDGRGEMLWLERIVGRDSLGRPSYRVLAVQRLPPLRDGEAVSLGLCYLEGGMSAPDGTILGIAVWEDAEVLREVRHAWRVHVRERRFEALDPGRVRCVNEGDGP